MDEILLKITNIIEHYESGAYVSKDKLIVSNRQLSSNIYYLTKFNIEAFKKFNSIIYNNKKDSNAKATVMAHELVPELRITRKILEACKNVSISINNELSIIKND